MTSQLLAWIRDQTKEWQQSAVGVFQQRGLAEDWPVHAEGPEELTRALTERGHLLPLPSEPAALAHIIEVELRSHFSSCVAQVDNASLALGTERSFPDLEFSGSAFGGGYRAVDIKCARRRKTGSGIKSRIALYTGNTYFLWPELKFSGIRRPFKQYEELLTVVAIYDFHRDLPERISNLQLVAHETWRLASRKRASTTREYIGSVQGLEQLVTGNGEFDTCEDFYAFWRSPSRGWKQSREADKLLRRALSDQDVKD